MALVTGASAGIGWAVCQQLALAGLRVVAVARRRERLEALQQHLVGMGVPIADFLPVVCDITKVKTCALCNVNTRRHLLRKPFWDGVLVTVECCGFAKRKNSTNACAKSWSCQLMLLDRLSTLFRRLRWLPSHELSSSAGQGPASMSWYAFRGVQLPRIHTGPRC